MAEAGDVQRICVFCGSRPGLDPQHVEAASAVGTTLARHGIGIGYGGASIGVMGALANAALAAGGTHLFDPNAPGGGVFGQACTDFEFWKTEVENRLNEHMDEMLARRILQREKDSIQVRSASSKVKFNSN